MKRKTSILWKTSICRKIPILLSAGIFGLQITGCGAVTDELIYGTETVLQGSDGYREFTGEDVHSPLIVFPDKEIESISEEFYYEFRDEIFSPVCQIYLKKEYNADEFTKEKERLAAEQLSYAGQTNQLYFDKDNFSSEAYVALADWSDRYEYAIIMEDASTILYVYLENITRDDLHMDETYLPAYFQDNNQSESTEESMTAEHRSFYAFKIGSQYVDCMDLADGPFAFDSIETDGKEK